MIQIARATTNMAMKMAEPPLAHDQQSVFSIEATISPSRSVGKGKRARDSGSLFARLTLVQKRIG